MISVVIPTYKNRGLFLSNLKRNLIHLKGCEIIVVNDDPSKSLEKDVARFPIVLIENKQNLGFGESVNKGVEQAKHNLVLLLNSDTVLLDESYKKSVSYFKQRDLFGVSFAQEEKNNRIVGKNVISWRRGLIVHQESPNRELGNTAWAEGGACMIDKTKFKKLLGFDGLFSPFYWEDIDLSYKAWRAGYKVIFDPSVVVRHYHESTIGTYFKNQYIETLAFRNQFIFIWKNLTDNQLLISHLLFLPFHLIMFIIKGRISFLKGFILALLRLPHIIKTRQLQKKFFIIPDTLVFQLCRE